MRGFGFPGCAMAVTVPISMKPKPSAAHAGRAMPFLSRPGGEADWIRKGQAEESFWFRRRREPFQRAERRIKCEAPRSDAIVK